ncbi:Asp f 13-like protein [Gloeophyllum trabeum ATCC 11539]|uniref:Asp f 13-like protein n=1 Tax=Gloeophyllum trabeum (strain ATCC 11539 / FP-39264 / Madison 617) TaxID=670483 RepID=S7QHP4_GLOTA|nr:Asp f 13-like protein [Gloeophyllum trabeum ATCC 11539]EPQ58697.1 Asp f 13-like protein [Gloeophyllum trabeum ATCC 11539]
MKFTSAVVTLTAALVSSVGAVTVSWDSAYDNSGQSLATTACSDGPNGLQTKGFTTFGSLPDYPYIGGASAVGAWNSPSCGSCWELTYNGKTITVLAVDHTDDGFNLSEAAMNDLTDGNAQQYGRVDAQATQVDASQCGL